MNIYPKQKTLNWLIRNLENMMSSDTGKNKPWLRTHNAQLHQGFSNKLGELVVSWKGFYVDFLVTA